METLTREQAVWAAGMGISIERARWLLECPKFTNGTIRATAQVRETKPDHHLVVVNGNLYFRINRAGLKVLERTPQDIGQARAYRDRRLVELGLKSAKV